jgi:ABC-type hemin transport system substrate-binding protein
LRSGGKPEFFPPPRLPAPPAAGAGRLWKRLFHGTITPLKISQPQVANAMTEQKINDALDELRKQGEEIDNPESKERLASLVDNIEQNVDYAGASEEHQDLIEDVKDAVTHFELEHPRITGVLNEIMMTLSNSGI